MRRMDNAPARVAGPSAPTFKKATDHERSNYTKTRGLGRPVSLTTQSLAIFTGKSGLTSYLEEVAGTDMSTILIKRTE